MEQYDVICFLSSPAEGVFLYHAMDRHTNSPVILKYIKVRDVYEIALLRKEIDNHIRVNAHPFVCKIYNFGQIQDSVQNSYMVLVLEQCITDLDQLRIAYSFPQQYFPERYLWTLMYECVEALAYAQDFVRTI